jgi:hypothetical protein
MSNQKREKMVSGLRGYLRSLANRRSSGVVTADDAHNYLGKNGIDEMKVRTRLSFINAAFSNGFEQVGYTYSSRPAAKGRSISEWTIA